MPNKRAKTEKVEAFSAPRELLELAKSRAAELGMTASGYYRYCLAKELGYSEPHALQIASHGAVRRLANTVERYRMPKSGALSLNEANSKPASAAAKLVASHDPLAKKPSSK
jgi:hypothetical protein